jgi:hypothetical protein
MLSHGSQTGFEAVRKAGGLTASSNHKCKSNNRFERTLNQHLEHVVLYHAYDQQKRDTCLMRCLLRLGAPVPQIDQCSRDVNPLSKRTAIGTECLPSYVSPAHENRSLQMSPEEQHSVLSHLYDPQLMLSSPTCAITSFIVVPPTRICSLSNEASGFLASDVITLDESHRHKTTVPQQLLNTKHFTDRSKVYKVTRSALICMIHFLSTRKMVKRPIGFADWTHKHHDTARHDFWPSHSSLARRLHCHLRLSASKSRRQCSS